METEDRTVAFAELGGRFALLQVQAEVMAVSELHEMRGLKKHL